MADIPTVIRDQLKAFELDIVHFTGDKLGEGSYGSVEIVEVAGERCAAKILHEALVEANSRLPSQRARGPGSGYQPRSLIKTFTTECTLMSEVRHPNIVRFLGICYRKPGENIPVIVMELLKTCLHEFLESETRKNEVIPLSIKLCILLDVSKGLVHLHSLDIVHRDLTARNVLLSESLTAKIADLGMARLIELKPGRQEATMTKGPGNANYMPPEARDGGPMTAQYGKAIDCFSMGHLILFTATQEFPEPLYPTYFDSLSKTTKVRTEIERREDSFQAAITEVGQDHPLLQVASQCLQNNPQIRPTAPEMMMRLENAKLRSDLNEHQCQSQRVISEFTHDIEDTQSRPVQAVRETFLNTLEQQQGVHKPKPVVRLYYTPRTPFSPPDPNDFPEPIVQSQSELARLNLIGGGDDGPCSMVGARSEQVGYNNDLYLNSLDSLASTMGSPEYNAEFNKQAEDAWKIRTPTQWLDKHKSPEDPSYGNFQPKDFKQYAKPAPEVKQKTEVSETTLGHQQTNEPSPNLPILDTPESDTTRVQANDWKHNMYDYENTRQPGFKPTAKPRNKIGVEKSSTGSHLPTPSIETPYKPHTSPLSSLEHQSLSSNDSGDFHSARSQQPTTLDNTTTTTYTMPERGRLEYYYEHEYEDVSVDSSTQELISTTLNLDSSEQPPSRPPGSLSPITRSRSAAVSKGSPTTSSSSIVATPHSATATALSPQSPDVVVSKKHLAVLSNAVARDRTYYTNLDKGSRSPVNSPQSPQLPQSQQSPQYSDTKVDGTWTCSYCTNLVFDSAIICDICSHERTTLV